MKFILFRVSFRDNTSAIISVSADDDPRDIAIQYCDAMGISENEISEIKPANMGSK